MTTNKSDAQGDGIQRRDFLNGLLVAASGLGFSGAVTPLAHAQERQAEDSCGDVVANDPRFARGGNLPSVFNVAHWLRDGRLRFDKDKVVVAPGCDPQRGDYPLNRNQERFDAIIIGGGLSGLSSAFYLLRRRPDCKILLLEANPRMGGNASYDDGAPLPVRASTCAAYMAAPDGDYLEELFDAAQINWKDHIIETPIESFYLDDRVKGFPKEAKGWRQELFDDPDALAQAPFDPALKKDLLKCQRAFRKWARTEGKPDEPPDFSDPQYDYLSRVTFADYLTKILRCDRRVVDYYAVYTVDCMGGTPDNVSAHTAISFLSAGQEKHFAFPGGTAEVANKLFSWLSRANLGKPSAFVSKTQAVALKVDHDGPGAKVIYYDNGQFHEVFGASVIVAANVPSAKHLVAHLLDDARTSAWETFNAAPAILANVAVKSMAPFHKLGLGYANFWWGSKHWSNFIVADWATPNRTNPNRPSVLTFYGVVTAPPQEFAAERMRLLSTPFNAYEASLREDLGRLMAGSDFDFDRDVSAIFLYRWGHSMIAPTTKSLFGDILTPQGTLDRSKAPRRIACRRLGAISFAGQYVEGTPSAESAIASGHRAALEVLAGF